MCILLNPVCFSQRFFYLDKGILKYAKSQTDVSLLPGQHAIAEVCRLLESAQSRSSLWVMAFPGGTEPSPHTPVPAALALDLGGLHSPPGEGAGRHPGYHRSALVLATYRNRACAKCPFPFLATGGFMEKATVKVDFLLELTLGGCPGGF